MKDRDLIPRLLCGPDTVRLSREEQIALRAYLESRSGQPPDRGIPAWLAVQDRAWGAKLWRILLNQDLEAGPRRPDSVPWEGPYASLVKALRAAKNRLPARLVQFMADRDEAPLQAIAENVY